MLRIFTQRRRIPKVLLYSMPIRGQMTIKSEQLSTGFIWSFRKLGRELNSKLVPKTVVRCRQLGFVIGEPETNQGAIVACSHDIPRYSESWLVARSRDAALEPCSAAP